MKYKLKISARANYSGGFYLKLKTKSVKLFEKLL